MFTDENVLKTYKKFQDKKMMCDFHCRQLKKKLAEDEKEMIEMTRFILDEHALVVKGQKVRNNLGEVLIVIECCVEWFTSEIRIEYYLRLDCVKSAYRTIEHEKLKEGFENGSWVRVTDKNKSFGKNTYLTKLFKHGKNTDTSTTYIGITAKGKCFVFTSWYDNLPTSDVGKIRIFRDSEGSYQLRNKYSRYYITLLGMYENHRELATDFLI